MMPQLTTGVDQRTKSTLKCNASECRRDVSDRAWITRCGHVFCDDCGAAKLLDRLPSACPCCSRHLVGPYDVLLSDLRPPPHFVQVALASRNAIFLFSVAEFAIPFEMATKRLSCLFVNVHTTQLPICVHQAKGKANAVELLLST